MVRLRVYVVTSDSRHLQACCRARCAHGLHAHDGVDPMIDSLVQMASLCAHFVGGVGCRAMGCMVWLEIQLAAICFAMRRRVRREIASSDVDLHRRVPHGCGGGRRLRRFRAPWARRARLQRVCDGHGMYCGRSGGGRVLVGAISSDFKVAQNSFAF